MSRSASRGHALRAEVLHALEGPSPRSPRACRLDAPRRGAFGDGRAARGGSGGGTALASGDARDPAFARRPVRSRARGRALALLHARGAARSKPGPRARRDRPRRDRRGRRDASEARSIPRDGAQLLSLAPRAARHGRRLLRSALRLRRPRACAPHRRAALRRRAERHRPDPIRRAGAPRPRAGGAFVVVGGVVHPGDRRAGSTRRSRHFRPAAGSSSSSMARRACSTSSGVVARHPGDACRGNAPNRSTSGSRSARSCLRAICSPRARSIRTSPRASARRPSSPSCYRAFRAKVIRAVVADRPQRGRDSAARGGR